MSKGKIMVVDDELAMVDLLRECFEDAGFDVVTAADGVNGLRQFFETQPELVITDVLMPRMDGVQLCHRIREISLVPIIMLTAIHLEDEKVRALHSGADDYLTKPVPRKELIARVEANLRRYRWPAAEAPAAYADPALRIDFARQEVYVYEERRSLTPSEYRLLVLLAARYPGETLSPQRLLTEVWGPEYQSPELVKFHMSNLRRKIEGGLDKGPRIVTVRGFGYRYEPPR